MNGRPWRASIPARAACSAADGIVFSITFCRSSEAALFAISSLARLDCRLRRFDSRDDHREVSSEAGDTKRDAGVLFQPFADALRTLSSCEGRFDIPPKGPGFAMAASFLCCGERGACGSDRKTPSRAFSVSALAPTQPVRCTNRKGYWTLGILLARLSTISKIGWRTSAKSSRSNLRTISLSDLDFLRLERGFKFINADLLLIY